MKCFGVGTVGWWWRKRTCPTCRGSGYQPPPRDGPPPEALDALSAQHKVERAAALRRVEQEALARRRGELQAEHESCAAVRVMRMIDQLRGSEGACVRIYCENPEGTGPDNHKIGVLDEWTAWHERNFKGQSLERALEAALRARSGAE